MLRARGINAEVINAGINGDTSCGMMVRMDSAVPPGTQIVILQPSGRNDRRKGCGGLQGNVAKMRSRLAARGIKAVHMSFMGELKRGYQQPDGIHLSAEGHTKAAAMILPQVLAAIRR
jgi:acyl-CoA thioesterase-1